MNYNIITLITFKKEIKRLSKKYPSFKDDLLLMQDELISNPNAGVDLGNGIRKIRMAIKSKSRGKSHGARVITVTLLISKDETDINLLFIYDKAEKSTITKLEIEILMKEAGF